MEDKSSNQAIHSNTVEAESNDVNVDEQIEDEKKESEEMNEPSACERDVDQPDSEPSAIENEEVPLITPDKKQSQDQINSKRQEDTPEGHEPKPEMNQTEEI